MDLPRFAIVMKDDDLDYWQILSMEGLMTYEQAREQLVRHRSNGCRCYLTALTFIAGPSTDLDA